MLRDKTTNNNATSSIETDWALRKVDVAVESHCKFSREEPGLWLCGPNTNAYVSIYSTRGKATTVGRTCRLAARYTTSTMLLPALKRSVVAPVNVSGRRGIVNTVNVSSHWPPVTSGRVEANQRVWQSFLHGSPEAKKDGELETQQHSRLVARGKYVHLIEGASSTVHVLAHLRSTFAVNGSAQREARKHRAIQTRSVRTRMTARNARMFCTNMLTSTGRNTILDLPKMRDSRSS